MKYTFALLLLGMALLPTFLFGQMTLPYEPLAPLPNTTKDCADGTGQCIDFEQYLPSVFTLLIGFAGVIAVVQIVIGGVMYLSTDAIQGKSAGKEKVKNALTGLILIIASYIILNTINPRALNLDLTIQSYNPPAISNERPTTTPPTGGSNALEERCRENNPCRNANACPANNTCDADAACNLQCIPTPTTCPGGTCSCINCVTVGSSATEEAFKGLPISASTNQIDKALAIALTGIVGPLRSANVPWYITEAYPPTRVHRALCHRQGTCIDADVTGNPPQVSHVVAFYNAARTMNLRVVYETSSQAEADALIRAGIPRAQNGSSGVLVLPANQITGNHFSVYKQ